MYDAKLCDFGLAIISNQDTERDGAGAIVGTSCYMSPETLAGHPSTKTDVYAFGVVSGHCLYSVLIKNVSCIQLQVLLELCTGLPPYSSKKKQSLVCSTFNNGSSSYYCMSLIIETIYRRHAQERAYG